MSKKEFFKHLDSEGYERLRVKLTTQKGELTDIVFQYESYLNNHWIAIVRYDMAHGFFHRDFMTPGGEKEKKKIEISDMKTASTYAEQDIQDKWEFYRAKYLNEIKRQIK